MPLWVTCIDVLFTILEIALFAYLAETKDVKVKKNLPKVCVVALIVICISVATYFSFPVGYKLCLLFVLCNVYQIYINKVNLKLSCFISFIYLLILLLSDAIAMGSLNIMGMDGYYSNILPHFYVLNLTIKICILYILVLVVRRLIKGIGDKISLGSYLIIMIPNMVNLAVVILIANEFYYNTNDVPKEIDGFLLMLAFILVAAIVCNIFISQYFLTVRSIERDEMLNMREIQIRYSYYKNLKSDTEQVHEIYHDMKNQLLALRSDTNIARRDKYIDEIYNKISRIESHFNTGSDYLDVIFHEKYKLAASKDIKFDVRVNIDKYGFIEELDLCTIFTNAIDNAIEECEQIKDVSERLILIRTKLIANFWSITFENSIREERIESVSDDMKSTKADKKNHGFGLKNIKNVLKAYDGEYSCRIKNNMFCFYILIPFNHIE